MITVNISGLDATFNAMTKQLPAEVEQVLTNEIRIWATETAGMAQNLAPVDEGHLRSSISPKVEGLIGSVTVNDDIGPFLEFGTKALAEAYVNTLPQDWREMAATFKGEGGGDYYDYLNAILDWVMRKGIANRYSVKTRQKIDIDLVSPKKSKLAEDDRSRLENAAYLIARKIMKVGIKPHPYLFPAYEINTKILIENLTKQFAA